MRNNKVLGIVLWAAGLAIALLFLAFVSQEWNGTVWAVAVCTVLTYIGHLALWLVLQKGKLDFRNLPALTISVAFLLLQTLWAVVVSFTAWVIPVKIALLGNVLFVIAQVVTVTMALMGKNHIETVDKRQKDHHTEVR